MKRVKHWQDPVNAVLGAWVVLSPWILGFQGNQAVMANAVIVGLALIAVAMGAVIVPRAWEEWTESALALWLVLSPWVLGYATMHTVTLAMVITGLVILALALWTLAIDKDYRSALHHGATP